MTQHTPRWRTFKRMQVSGTLFAALLYLGVSVHAWGALDWPEAQKRLIILWAPLTFAGFTLTTPLAAPFLRRPLKRYVWMSYAVGFGQSVVSVLGGLGVLALAAFFIWLQVHDAQTGGRPPAGIFSAFGAGLGILGAQFVLCLALEREPEVRRLIEEPGP